MTILIIIIITMIIITVIIIITIIIVIIIVIEAIQLLKRLKGLPSNKQANKLGFHNQFVIQVIASKTLTCCSPQFTLFIQFLVKFLVPCKIITSTCFPLFSRIMSSFSEKGHLYEDHVPIIHSFACFFSQILDEVLEIWSEIFQVRKDVTSQIWIKFSLCCFFRFIFLFNYGLIDMN